MPENTPQTFSNHTRLDRPFHFFVAPVTAISVLVAIWETIQRPGFETAWSIVFALAVAVLAFKARSYALRAQDRVIRLEERMRLSEALPETLRLRIGELSESQLIALRFACDAELPGLVEKALSGRLSNAEIKKTIVSWRPDYFRV
jgi:hypothetical protein